MLANGNSKPMQCVANLLRIVRGECVYDRIKGIDPTIVDQPSEIARPLLIADAKWLIKTYEPRVDITSMNLAEMLAQEGSYAFNVNANVEE